MISLLAMMSLVPALAVESSTGLAWSWTDGVPRTLYVESIVMQDIPTYVRGKRNLEARLTQIEIKFVTTCTPEQTGKKRWEHTCVIDDLAVLGSPFRENESEDLEAIMLLWDEQLTGGTIDIVQSTSGRVTSFNLTGLDTSERKLSDTAEYARQLMHHAMSGLDLEFNRRGDDRVWLQPVTRMVQIVGDIGSVPTGHLIAKRQDDMYAITSYGEGVVNQSYDVKVSGDSLFDNESGSIAYRSWKVLAAKRMETGNRNPLATANWMAVVGPQEDRPSVGESGLWATHAVRDTATTLLEVVLQDWDG